MSSNDQNHSNEKIADNTKLKVLDFIRNFCDHQYLIKVAVTILFVVIICAAITLLISNFCSIYKGNQNISENISIKKAKLDTLIFIALNFGKDSITIRNNNLNEKIHDSVIAIVVKNGILNDNANQSDPMNSNFSQEDTIKIVTILFSVFTAIFGIFTFLTQNNLNRAEKTKDDIDKLKKNIVSDFNGVQKKIEDKIESLNIIADENKKEFKEISNQSQKRSEMLLKNAAELLNRNVEDNKRYRDLWFLIANQFLQEDKQPSVSNLRDIIELWDSERAKFAALNLAARGDKKCLLFLEDRFNYYNISGEPENKNLANYIQIAISEIKKREGLI